MKSRKKGDKKEEGELSDDDVEIIETKSPKIVEIESDDDDFEEKVHKMAVKEILKETKISKIRAESSGTWHCELKKTNKRFLKSAIVATLSHNQRVSSRQKDGSERKLARLDRRTSRYNERDNRMVRNPYYMSKYSEERERNYRRKYERAPRRSPPRVKFVKPRDLDERVLIPGVKSKKARIKEINFVAPHGKGEQFLGHDGSCPRMERIRHLLADKLQKKEFVPPFLEKDRFFILSGEQVAGLIRKSAQEEEKEPPKLMPIIPPQLNPIGGVAPPPELVAFYPW